MKRRNLNPSHLPLPPESSIAIVGALLGAAVIRLADRRDELDNPFEESASSGDLSTEEEPCD
jgi:hypothetical protein